MATSEILGRIAIALMIVGLPAVYWDANPITGLIFPAGLVLLWIACVVERRRSSNQGGGHV